MVICIIRQGNYSINRRNEWGWAYSNIESYRNHPYPISIIMGERDMIDPGGKKFEYWSSQLPNVSYTMINEAAHNPWIDNPEEFREAFNIAMKKYESNN